MTSTQKKMLRYVTIRLKWKTGLLKLYTFQARSHTVVYAGIRRGRKFFLSMLKNFVRIRTYGLYDKHTLGTR